MYRAGRTDCTEQMYQAVFETTGTATIIIDEDTTIRLANAEFERLSGYSKQEVEGRMRWTDFIVNTDIPRMLTYHHLRRVKPGVAPRQYECRFIDRGRHIRNTILTIDMIPGTRQSVGSFSDITTQKRLEEEARQRLAELAHSSRISTLGEMAAEVAHELNQPLFAIVNYAEACTKHIRSGRITEDTLLRALADIAKEAERAGRIIYRLRDFIRKGKPELARLNLNEVVQEAVALAETEARRRAVPIRTELSADNPMVKADRVQIQQVVLNLLRNGMEAMSDVSPSDRELILRTSVDAGHVAEVEVVDRGHGLTPAIADRLFEPFFTTRPDGMGMGLSISKTIVNAHGGRIWASPNPDRGCTFRFALPMDARGGFACRRNP